MYARETELLIAVTSCESFRDPSLQDVDGACTSLRSGAKPG